MNYTGATVGVKLIRMLHCQKFTEELAAVTLANGEPNTCAGVDVPPTWDFANWTYYVEVTLTRTSITPDPQLHQLHLQ